MPQTPDIPYTRGAVGRADICRLANARGTADIGPVLAQVRRRSSTTITSAAIKAALDRGWLHRDGDSYVVTPSGAALGRSRSGSEPGACRRSDLFCAVMRRAPPWGPRARRGPLRISLLVGEAWWAEAAHLCGQAIQGCPRLRIWIVSDIHLIERLLLERARKQCGRQQSSREQHEEFQFTGDRSLIESTWGAIGSGLRQPS